MCFEAIIALVFFIGFVGIIGILIYNSEQSFREQNERLKHLRDQAILDRPLPPIWYTLEDLKEDVKKPTKKKPTKKRPTKKKVLSIKKKSGVKKNKHNS